MNCLIAGEGGSVDNTTGKVVKAELGLQELARKLGNVFQLCQIISYSRDTPLAACPRNNVLNDNRLQQS